MLAKIIAEVKHQNVWRDYMRSISPYYPEFRWHELQLGSDDKAENAESVVVYLATFVRILRGGKWYKVFYFQFIDSTHGRTNFDCLQLLNRAIKEVHQIQHCYKLTGKFEEIDDNQQPESERII